MVSWWPGDGNANDIQGANNGTLENGATFASGEVGQAFSLDGVDDEIAITHTAALNFGHNDSFSIDAWLKAPNSVLGTQRAAVSLTYVCSPESILLSLLTDGTIDFSIRDSNNIDIDTISPSSIVDGPGITSQACGILPITPFNSTWTVYLWRPSRIQPQERSPERTPRIG